MHLNCFYVTFECMVDWWLWNIAEDVLLLNVAKLMTDFWFAVVFAVGRSRSMYFYILFHQRITSPSKSDVIYCFKSFFLWALFVLMMVIVLCIAGLVMINKRSALMYWRSHAI